MEPPLHHSAEQLEDTIQRLKNGTATHDDVALVKEYLHMVEGVIKVFDDSVNTMNTKEGN